MKFSYHTGFVRRSSFKADFDAIWPGSDKLAVTAIADQRIGKTAKSFQA
jgi:hypothetical protein